MEEKKGIVSDIFDNTHIYSSGLNEETTEQILYRISKENKKIYFILILIFGIVVIIFMFSFINYINSQKKIDYGNNIERGYLSKNGEYVYVKLKEGLKIYNTNKIKFNFFSDNGTYNYVIIENKTEYALQKQNFFDWLFGGKSQSKSNDYIIKVSDLGIENFNKIKKIEINIEDGSIDSGIDIIPLSPQTNNPTNSQTQNNSSNKTVRGTSGGGGGNSGRGTTPGCSSDPSCLFEGLFCYQNLSFNCSLYGTCYVKQNISSCNSYSCNLSSDCTSRCSGQILYSNGSCSGESCSYFIRNCSSSDGWQSNGNNLWNSTGECSEKEEIQEELRSYNCVSNNCSYSVSQTRWVESGQIRNKTDGTLCNDSNPDTDADICISGACVGSYNITISVATLKSNYTVDEIINLTDPPMNSNAFSISSSAQEPVNSVDIREIFDNYSDVISVNKELVSIDASGYIKLKNDAGYARIIAVTNDGKEILVFGSDNLDFEKNRYDFSKKCDESCFFENQNIVFIKVEAEDADIYIDNINYIQKTSNIISKLSTLEAEDNLNKISRDEEKLKKIQDNIKNKNLKWIAGDTPILHLTYSEKKKLFGGKLPNLYGYDAYKGGLFYIPLTTKDLEEIKNKKEEKLKAEQEINGNPGNLFSDGFGMEYGNFNDYGLVAIPSSFDWRNKHNQSWVTSVKNQASCGSCWAFSAAGASEGVINLYFNQHIDANLAEQDLVSCSPAGDCGGGWPDSAINYINSSGIANETCFPYTATDSDCSNKCSNWQAGAWRTGISKSVTTNTQSIEKALLNYGTLSMVVWSWSHAITAVGYSYSGNDFYVTYKNSWGSSWGNNGYGQMLINKSILSNFDFYYVDLPITAPPNRNLNISCVDNDSDGYCNWGIGPKPSSGCPSCSNLEDFDDSNASINLLENCRISGDEDNNGLADCNDTINCPAGTICSTDENMHCNATKSCEFLPIIKKWNQTIGGDDYDYGYGIKADPQNNIYVTGETSSFGAGNTDLWILKFNSSGNLIWNKTAGNSNTEEGRGVNVDSNGNIYVAGTHYSGSYTNIWLLKYNSSGSLVWNKSTGGSNNENGYGVETDSQNNIYVIGDTYSYGVGNSDVWTLKYNSSGNLIWNKTFGGSNYESSYGIDSDLSGNIYVAGRTASFGAGSYDILTLKYNSSGSLLWNRTFGDAYEDYGYGIVADNQGNIYTTGYVYGASDYDLILLKYNSSGSLLWNTTSGGPGNDYGWDVKVDSDDNPYVTGYTNSFGGGGYDLWLLKFNSSGNLLFNNTYGKDSSEYGLGISLDSKNNIYTVGYNYDDENYYDLWLMKFSEYSVCENNKREGEEECDGTSSSACPNRCSDLCTCLPESKIVNYANINLTGNLKMILQKKNGNEWINQSVVVDKTITINSNNYYKLDSEWNPNNIVTGSLGNYRVYVSFEVDTFMYNQSWEFNSDSSGGSLGKISGMVIDGKLKESSFILRIFEFFDYIKQKIKILFSNIGKAISD